MSSAEPQKQQAAAEQTEAVSIMDQVYSATKVKSADSKKKSELDGFMKALMEQVNSENITVSKDAIKSIDSAVAAIDEKVSEQLSAVMHHEEFQKLEGSWRGLHHLVFNSETGEDLKIRVLNVGKRELFNDLDRAIEFDQSQTFKKLYSSEFDMPGGMPYGALIGNYEFTNHPEDIDLMEGMSGIAASAHCPFITAPSAELFGFESWTEMSGPRDLKKIFEAKEYIKWRSLRESEDSRYLVMAMPRALSRLPYGANTKAVEEFAFEEVPLGDDGKPIEVSHDSYCWMNAAFVLGAQLTDAFAKYGWCTSIRGAENGGRVDGLPTHVVKNDKGETAQKCPTEIAITDRRENELSDCGFLPLCHYKDTDYAVFFGAQTVQKPKKYNKPEATENAKISARLPYIMASSRIAHYLKVIARDKIGSFMEREDCQKWLEDWIADYISADDSPAPEQKARYPLREAKIEVKEVPGDPGHYSTKIMLRPWLQLEKLNASISMVSKLRRQD